MGHISDWHRRNLFIQCLDIPPYVSYIPMLPRRKDLSLVLRVSYIYTLGNTFYHGLLYIYRSPCFNEVAITAAIYGALRQNFLTHLVHRFSDSHGSKRRSKRWKKWWWYSRLGIRLGIAWDFCCNIRRYRVATSCHLFTLLVQKVLLERQWFYNVSNRSCEFLWRHRFMKGKMCKNSRVINLNATGFKENGTTTVFYVWL